MRLLFQSDTADPARWRAALLRLVPDLDFRVWPQVGDPAGIDMMLVLRPPPGGVRDYAALRFIQLISAGANQLAGYPLPAHVPVARLIEPGQVGGMIEYVLHAVLHHHRGFDRYARQQAARCWLEHPRLPAAERVVAVLGLGALGAPVAQALARFGFRVLGWSRSGRQVADIAVHGGAQGLRDVLAEAQIVVGLLPLSPETVGLYDAGFFAAMRPGSFFINAGRGAQLDQAALGRALQSGHLAGATLDVLAEEPPAADDPVWDLPNLILTPHVATSPDPATAAAVVVDNWHRVLRGEPPAHAVAAGDIPAPRP